MCDENYDSIIVQPTFERELRGLINRYSKENGSNTPDFLLAEYLIRCLENWDISIKQRECWYGRVPKAAEVQLPFPTE